MKRILISVFALCIGSVSMIARVDAADVRVRCSLEGQDSGFIAEMTKTSTDGNGPAFGLPAQGRFGVIRFASKVKGGKLLELSAKGPHMDLRGFSAVDPGFAQGSIDAWRGERLHFNCSVVE